MSNMSKILLFSWRSRIRSGRTALSVHLLLYITRLVQAIPSLSLDLLSGHKTEPTLQKGVIFSCSWPSLPLRPSCGKTTLLSSRKEVFQPHLPVRLPCYDLAPVTSFTLGRSSRLRTSGTPGSHGLTGGVYKARERIHRAMADARLLANPASRSRVADSDPN